MGGARGVAVVAAALLLATPARGADLAALEGAIREASAERVRLVEERARRMGEAAVLADEIAHLKEGAHPPLRAERGLEDALKRFDRVAAQLDAIDRRISTQDRLIVTLRRKFDDAAAVAASRLGGQVYAGPVGQVASELHAIDQARSRVARLGTAEPAFRPLLDVKATPDDGALEVQQKVQLLETERDRVLKALGHADADASVLTTRMLSKQRLSRELEAAARTAGSELAILRRETENVAQALHELDAQREAVVRQKAALSAALVQVDGRLEELRAALRQLAAPKGDIR